MKAPRRREIYEAILHRLQHPTATTIEEAAMGLTEDVIGAIVEMPDDPMLTRQEHPLSLTLRGRHVVVTLDGTEPTEFPTLDRVERAALVALVAQAQSLLRADGGVIRPGGYIAPTGLLPFPDDTILSGRHAAPTETGIGGE